MSLLILFQREDVRLGDGELNTAYRFDEWYRYRFPVSFCPFRALSYKRRSSAYAALEGVPLPLGSDERHFSFERDMWHVGNSTVLVNDRPGVPAVMVKNSPNVMGDLPVFLRPTSGLLRAFCDELFSGTFNDESCSGGWVSTFNGRFRRGKSGPIEYFVGQVLCPTPVHDRHRAAFP